MTVPLGILAVILMIVSTRQLFTFLQPDVNLATLIPTWLLILLTSSSLVIMPVWVWGLSEYKLNRKTNPIKHYWWLWIEPLAALMLSFINVLPLASDIYPSLELALGGFQQFHRVYMFLVASSVLLWSLNVIRVKTQSNTVSVLQFGVCFAVPMLLFFAYRIDLIDRPLGGAAMILLLLWSAREANLLDIIPSALNGVINRLDVGVLVFNAQQRQVYSNDFATRVLEPYLLEKSHQNNLSLLTTVFDFQYHETQLARLTLGDDQGTPIIIDLSLQQIVNSQTQQNLGYIILLQDISEIEKNKVELERGNQKLSELNRLKSVFFAGISHEFRTPLTLSQASIDELLSVGSENMSGAQKSSIINIKNQNNQLISLVTQLVELAQHNEGDIPLQVNQISLKKFALELLAQFDSVAQNVELSLADNSMGSDVYFDATALHKIITNLLSNAIKSINGNDGKVNVEINDHSDEFLSLSVSDNGCGISEQDLPQIFDAFYSQGKPSAVWPQGTGIGLHLVKQIVKQHEALINVDSEIGQGTRFTLLIRRGHAHFSQAEIREQSIKELPVIEAPTFPNALSTERKSLSLDESALAVDTHAEVNEQEKLILVVEDNVQMRRHIRRHLAPEFRLIEAEDGEEGFDLAVRSVPDLIVTDLMMPKLDGLEFSQQIRTTTATSHIPIVMLTANALQQTKLDSFAQGVDQFLTKPFDVNELLVRIRSLLEARDRVKQRYASKSTLTENNELDSTETTFLANLGQFARSNLNAKELRISDIAKHANMSERSLQRKLKALTDLSPKQWLLHIKVQAAHDLLISTNNTITSIGLDTGFNDSAHFSKAFKTHYGASPSQYRKQYHL